MGVSVVTGQAGDLLAARVTRAPSLGRVSEEKGSVQIQGPNPTSEKGQEQRVKREVVEAAVSQRSGTRLRFDENSNQVITQIVDQNNEVIKQIPPEEMLKIAARFNELRGKLFDESV